MKEYPLATEGIPFDLERQVIYTNSGQVVYWSKKMPSLASLLSHSVFYLYDDEESANDGVYDGATGFFVSYTTEERRTYLYAVTNAHVIDGGSKVLRVNRKGGGFGKPLDLSNAHWEKHKTADVAATELELLDDEYQYMAIPLRLFCAEELILAPRGALAAQVAIGDEVYMLGRFVYHAGQTRNRPAARSGMISVLPDPNELIPLEGVPHPQEAFLIELRSYFGFSGSPVFWHNSFWENIDQMRFILERCYQQTPHPDTPFPKDAQVLLLGIDCGAYTHTNSVMMKDPDGTYRPIEGIHVESAAGFAIVVPAWQILDVLNSDVFSTKRQTDMEKDKPPQKKGGARAHSRSLEPISRDAFEEALRKASQKVSEPALEKKETSE